MSFFWALFTVSIVAISLTTGAAISMWHGFRRPGPSPDAEHSGLSMMVPIKGSDANTPGILRRLVRSEVPGPVEFLLAMESGSDPAYPICRQVQAEHPDREIRIILSGPPAGLMGKQHNLAAAAAAARYPILGSMDADVAVEPDTLAQGLRHLARPGAGTAFFLPRYTGRGPAGGALAELYCNYHYGLFMGNWALRANAPFIIGALWLMARSTLERTGGFGSFGLTVSDDAVIGQSVARLGLRNLMVPHTVSMPREPLDLRAGFGHLAKWLGMLRAQGPGAYLAIWLTWHPIFWSAVTAVAGYVAGDAAACYGIALAAAAVAAKWLAALLLDTGVYHVPPLRHAAALVAYELLAVPLLFIPGLFRRTIEWKGRRYRLGPGGRILAVDDLP